MAFCFRFDFQIPDERQLRLNTHSAGLRVSVTRIALLRSLLFCSSRFPSQVLNHCSCARSMHACMHACNTTIVQGEQRYVIRHHFTSLALTQRTLKPSTKTDFLFQLQVRILTVVYKKQKQKPSPRSMLQTPQSARCAGGNHSNVGPAQKPRFQMRPLSQINAIACSKETV